MTSLEHERSRESCAGTLSAISQPNLTPRGLTNGYNNAQKPFQDSTLETWDESRPHEFLLEQGVVEPSISSTVTDTFLSFLTAGRVIPHDFIDMLGGYSITTTSLNQEYGL